MGFKTGQEKVRDGLIGGSLMLSQVNKEQRTLFRIQEDLSMNQQKSSFPSLGGGWEKVDVRR
jgi:hypothetical protein